MQRNLIAPVIGPDYRKKRQPDQKAAPVTTKPYRRVPLQLDIFEPAPPEPKPKKPSAEDMAGPWPWR